MPAILGPLAASLALTGLSWLLWSWGRPPEETKAERATFRASMAWYVMLTILPSSLLFFWFSFNARTLGVAEEVAVPLRLFVWFVLGNALLLFVDRLPVVGSLTLPASNEIKARFYGGWLSR